MDWQPQPDGLQQILEILRNGQSTDNKVQAENRERLAVLAQHQDFPSYLLHVTIFSPNEDIIIRKMAALVLKSSLSQIMPKLPPSNVDHIKKALVQGLSDSDKEIRNVCGTVISNLLYLGGLKVWPELISGLVQFLDAQNYDTVEGSLRTLEKICEDHGKELELEINGVVPAHLVFPKFLTLMDSSDQTLSLLALSCISNLLISNCPSFNNYVEAIRASLFKKHDHSNPEVRKLVCKSLIALLELRPDALMSELNNLIQYMIHCTKSEDDYVALEACEFWMAVADLEEVSQHIPPYLPAIIPTLLERMVYSEEEIFALGGDEDDAEVPDEAKDIKPHHHHSKVHSHQHIPNSEDDGGKSKSGGNKDGMDGDNDDDDDDYDDDDDDDDDDDRNEWNIRKCAAASLDLFSHKFEAAILPPLFPLLQSTLQSQDWKVCESGILALGAIAEGCYEGIESHLPELIPLLLQNLQNRQRLIRSISCWTLSRYVPFMVKVATPEHLDLYMTPVLQSLLTAILDNSKKVQETACSAFSVLAESARSLLEPYLDPIINTLSTALGKYQRKNMAILYDAIGTLVDAVGSSVNHPRYLELFMPRLMNTFSTQHDEDRDALPLCECLGYICTGLQDGILPYAPALLEKSFRIVSDILMTEQLFLAGQIQESPDKEFLVAYLDLLSSLAQALGPQSEQLLANYANNIPQIILASMADTYADVRQSAYAVLGDFAVPTGSILEPHMNDILNKLVSEIAPENPFPNVCNNAIWSLGELSLVWRGKVAQFVAPIMERLIKMLMIPSTIRTIAENCAITLGRLGVGSPEIIAPHLEHFSEPWFRVLRYVTDNTEKASAFQGMLNMIQMNPTGLTKSFVFFCDAVVNYQNPGPFLDDYFKQILEGYKTMVGPNWDSYFSTFPEAIKNPLITRYGL